MNAPQLTTINMKRSDRQLALEYTNGESYEIPYELLRVYSPSAEVQGHGPGQETLQTDKENILIEGIQAVGNYAIQIFFNDGHDSGIFSWNYLYELATEQDAKWDNYLQRLKQAGIQRKTGPSQSDTVVQLFDPKAS